jgi:hypothetical protein
VIRTECLAVADSASGIMSITSASRGKSIVNAMRTTLLVSCFALAACAPTLHPIVTRPAIPNAEAVQRLCLDYMKQVVPAGSLSEAVGVAHERHIVFDNCLAAHGWTE